MLPEDTLFNAVSTSISGIVRLKREGKDIKDCVKESLAIIDEIEMEVSFPEQQASGSAIIIAAKFMLPDMTVDEKLTVAPLFHSALELISSFDKVSTIRWNTVLPLFHHYMHNIPREVPSTIKYLEVIRKILDVMKLSRTVTNDFFSFENLIHISRIIQTSLVYAKNPDGDLVLKKLSIDLLSRMVRQCPPEKAPVVGVLISGYLAGLLKIINTQNVADVVENAIIIFTDAVILVFDNDAERFDINQVDKIALRKVMPVILEKHNDKWLKNAEAMVFDYVKNILERHMRNKAHNVKMAVCQMIMHIQSRCTTLFGNRFYDYLLFIYTNLRYDEAVYFQDLSKSCLVLVRDKKVVEAYFYKEIEAICRRLPVQTRSGHGDRELRILSAVLDGLGEAVSLMCTMESPIVEKVLQAIVDCIEINKKGMQITSEGLSTSIDQEIKKYKLMHNLSHGPLNNVARILAELGKFEIIHVVHKLMKVESAARRSGYHLLLAYMLSSLERRDACPDEPTIMMLAEYLVKESNRSCVIYLKDDDKPKTDTLEHDWNTCIEGLSCTNVALCMKFISGNGNRSKIIIKSICTILNQSICSSWIGMESADFALKIIADYDDEVNDVLELVNRYSAYILNQVSLSCSSSNNYHVAPILLRAYLRYDNIDDKFDDFRVIIEKMLYALDNNEQKYTVSLLQALRAFTAAVNKEWMDLQPIGPLKSSEDHKSLPTPQHILVEKILLRTKHMLTSPKLPLQLNCMHILMDGLDILKNYDDMLLPMIHQNWSGIMTVMKARDPVSMIPAIEVVGEMAVKSGTFVHNKVLKEMWPAVGPYLIHCFEHINSWKFSTEYRMVLKVIEIMPHLVTNIGLTELETRDSFMVLLNIAIDDDGDFTMISRTQKSQIERHYRDLAATGRNTNN